VTWEQTHAYAAGSEHGADDLALKRREINAEAVAELREATLRAHPFNGERTRTGSHF